MSADEADRPVKQFDQSIPVRIEPMRLDQHYKSIGISAVNAAAHFTSKAKKEAAADVVMTIGTGLCPVQG